MMSDKNKFASELLSKGLFRYFLEAIFAKLLWNGVGHSLLGLPIVTYWQMLGLTLLVALILPQAGAQHEVLMRILFDKDGKEKP